LLVVAILFCHGFLGVLHQTCGPPEHSHLTAQHSAHAPGDSGDHSEAHLGCSDYAAVLISVLLGAVICLLLKGVRTWSRFALSRFLERYYALPLVLHPSRGPTIPILQVFRL